MRKDFAGVITILFLGSAAIALSLSIEPNHDKPCVVGDIWAEECMSCVCMEGRIASCRRTYCASRLRRDLDECKEGEITQVGCNTCECKKNQRVCTKKNCKLEKKSEKQRHSQKRRNKLLKD